MTAAFAAYLAALLTAHTVADHWIQTHHQAMCKGKPGRVGVLACLRHVARFARWIGKADFLRLGVPRTGIDRNGNEYDDNPSLGTAGYSLDQSFHHLCLFFAALLTVTL